MDRRSALKTASILLGGTLSAGTVAAVMSGCQPNKVNDWMPKPLSESKLELLGEVVDIILPATDTPGAKELLVHHFMDKMITDCFTKEEYKKIMEGLTFINSASVDSAGKDFVDASAAEQLAILSTYDKEAAKDGSHFFRSIKGLAIKGYFSTEIGQTQALQHIAVPGKYEGCVSLAEVGEGRAWAQR